MKCTAYYMCKPDKLSDTPFIFVFSPVKWKISMPLPEGFKLNKSNLVIIRFSVNIIRSYDWRNEKASKKKKPSKSKHSNIYKIFRIKAIVFMLILIWVLWHNYIFFYWCFKFVLFRKEGKFIPSYQLASTWGTWKRIKEIFWLLYDRSFAWQVISFIFWMKDDFSDK